MTQNVAEDRTIRIPVNSLMLDAPLSWLEYLWNSAKEVLSSMVLLWIEPILDSKSLLDLSIGLLLLERVGANIQRYEPKIILNQAAHSPPNMEASIPGGILFGTPFIAILGSFALVISCLSNAPHDTRLFAPTWLRMLLPRHRPAGSSSTVLVYMLLFLFCLESMLMISILMFGCHAITFPEWLEGDIKILTSLMGAWLVSILASSFVRYFLYYSIGD